MKFHVDYFLLWVIFPFASSVIVNFVCLRFLSEANIYLSANSEFLTSVAAEEKRVHFLLSAVMCLPIRQHQFLCEKYIECSLCIKFKGLLATLQWCEHVDLENSKQL